MIEQYATINDKINFCRPRKNEKGRALTYRTQRLFTVAHEWFFSTREGIDQGPFLSRQVAELAIEIYIDSINTQAQHHLKQVK